MIKLYVDLGPPYSTELLDQEAFADCASLAQITLRANRVGDLGVGWAWWEGFLKCLENGRPSTPPTPYIFQKKHSKGVLFVHVISLQPSSAPKSPSPTWKSFRYVIHISGEFFSLAGDSGCHHRKYSNPFFPREAMKPSSRCFNLNLTSSCNSFATLGSTKIAGNRTWTRIEWVDVMCVLLKMGAIPVIAMLVDPRR